MDLPEECGGMVTVRRVSDGAMLGYSDEARARLAA
jgi:hypothetical protein